MNYLQNLSDVEIKEKLNIKTNKGIFLYLYDPNSGLCKLLDRDIEEGIRPYTDSIRAYRINTNINKDIAYEYNIMQVPAFVYIKPDGGIKRLTEISYNDDVKRKIVNFLEADFFNIKGNLKIVTEDNFEKEVLKSLKLVMVNFWVSGLDTCWSMKKDMEKLQLKYYNRLKIVIANVDESRGLAIRHNIKNLPTLIFFKNSREVNRIGGMRTFDSLEKRVVELL